MSFQEEQLNEKSLITIEKLQKINELENSDDKIEAVIRLNISLMNRIHLNILKKSISQLKLKKEDQQNFQQVLEQAIKRRQSTLQNQQSRASFSRFGHFLSQSLKSLVTKDHKEQNSTEQEANPTLNRLPQACLGLIQKLKGFLSSLSKNIKKNANGRITQQVIKEDSQQKLYQCIFPIKNIILSFGIKRKNMTEGQEKVQPKPLK